MQLTSPSLHRSVAPLFAAAAGALLLSSAALARQSRGAAPVVVDPLEPHLVVRLLPGIAPDSLAASFGGNVLRADLRRGIHLIDVPGATKAVLESLAWAVKDMPTVLYAEVDETVDPPESLGCGLPEEVLGAQQCTIAFIDWTPSPGEYDAQSASNQMQCAEAHALATGDPLLVAVIDTGLDLNHELFADRIAPGGWDYLLDIPGGADAPNGLDDDGDTSVDEGAGHGSHVSGLVLLADPNAMILPLRVLDSDGNGSAFLVAMAIYDAVDAGATTINLSLSTRYGCEVFAEALMYAEYHGVDVVASSGNAGTDTQFPGSYVPADYAYLSPPWLPSGTVLTGENLLTVSSVDELDIKPYFACFGPAVDLSAPGYDVYSAQLGGHYAWWSGTSMSAGLASGSLTYLKSIWSQGSYPGTPAEVLQTSAVDLDGLNPSYAGGLGAGRIDLLGATTLLLGL